MDTHLGGHPWVKRVGGRGWTVGVRTGEYEVGRSGVAVLVVVSHPRFELESGTVLPSLILDFDRLFSSFFFSLPVSSPFSYFDFKC